MEFKIRRNCYLGVQSTMMLPHGATFKLLSTFCAFIFRFCSMGFHVCPKNLTGQKYVLANLEVKYNIIKQYVSKRQMAVVTSFGSAIKPFSKYLLIKETKPRDAHLAFVEADSSMQFHVLVKVLFVLKCLGTHFTFVYGHSVMSIHVSRQFRLRYTLLSYKTMFHNVITDITRTTK